MGRTIMVGTDGSDTSFRAVDKAAEVAAGEGASLLIATAYRPPSRAERSAAAEELGDLAYQVTGSHPAEDVARAAVGRALAMGVRADYLVREGDPVPVLLDLVQERSVDVLVIGNVGLRGLAGRLTGSVPAGIGRRARCEVLIVDTTGTGG